MSDDRDLTDERIRAIYQRLGEIERQRLEAKADDRDRVETALLAVKEANDLQATALSREFHEHLIQYRREVDLSFAAQQKAMEAAFASSEKAILKAEAANERRFESVNEFRATLADQQRSFLTRVEYDAAHDNLVERVNGLTDRLNLAEGKGQGYSAVWLAGVAAVSLIIAIVVAANAVFGR